MPRHARPQVDVVVTGLGAITPLGDSLEALWSGLAAGRSGISRLDWVDDGVYGRVGGDMSHWDFEADWAAGAERVPQELLSRSCRALRDVPRSSRMAVAAALAAMSDAGWPSPPPERFGLVLAGHNLGLRYHEDNSRRLAADPEDIEPFFALRAIDSDVVGLTCDFVGAQGPSFLVGSACASGATALMAGLDLLRSGRADMVLVVGGPCDFDNLYLQGFAFIEALSFRAFNDCPERASRPFDGLREGFVPSVMAGAILLERAPDAAARGRQPWAGLLGAASLSDADRGARPNSDGQARTMGAALADAGLGAADVGYVNAHAASTPLGDASEVAAVKRALGQAGRYVPINSTKSMLGHGLTSAGVIEAIATMLQMRHGLLHPTINQEVPDPALDLDFVPNVARPYRFDVALSNNFGLGGLNACVVLGRRP
jgi:3-oxoacyl-(acyl-carrier-protein) synthase